MSLTKGIDVSVFQGSINWKRVAQDRLGITFGIARGGDGIHYVDQTLEANVAGMLEHGIYPMVYQYQRLHVPSEGMVNRNVETWERAIREGLPKGSIFWLDMEDIYKGEEISAAGRVSWLQRVVSEMSGTGIRMGIYTGRWWWVPYMSNTDVFRGLPLWHAAYPYHPEPPPDDTPQNMASVLYGGWKDPKDPLIWQYASTGRVDGIDGNVDLNVAPVGVFRLSSPDPDPDPTPSPTPTPTPPPPDPAPPQEMWTAIDDLRKKVDELEERVASGERGWTSINSDLEMLEEWAAATQVNPYDNS